MANLDFLNQFAVGGKQQSSAPKTSTSEKKANNENATIRNFINNFRKMAEAAKVASDAGVQPEATYKRIANTGRLEDTKFDGKSPYGVGNPLVKTYEQTGYKSLDQIKNGGSVKDATKNFLSRLHGMKDEEDAKNAEPEEDPNDFVEYTYKPGDTFGQVILDLGIDTNKGLWGSDGDVAFYTKQLRDQGIPGMVPIGTKIRLKKRK